MATAKRIVRPLDLDRFSGTTSVPQRAVAIAGRGMPVLGQGPDSNFAGAAFFAAFFVLDDEQAAPTNASVTSRTTSRVAPALASE
jgi:hypothetical protein